MNNPVYRNFINALVKKLFPNPLVEVNGPENLVLTVNEKENTLLINLINLSGPHANTRIARYDSVDPIGPIDIKIRMNRIPKKLTLQPENIPLKFSYKDGMLETRVERVDVYSIITAEQ
jgi:hypothetical protein